MAYKAANGKPRGYNWRVLKAQTHECVASTCQAGWYGIRRCILHTALAERTLAGEVQFSDFSTLSDEQIIEQLTRVKGVGVWTVQMFLIFALQRPNVLPTGDLGIQMAMRKHYRKRKLPKPHHMEKIAKSWSPYRSVACWYLWRSLDIKTM